MKVPLSWLKEFVPVADAERLTERLTLGGFEVEGIESVEGEKVLEVAVSPNRGDCLSMRGLAREVAVLMGLTFRDLGRDGGRDRGRDRRVDRPRGARPIRDFISVKVSDRRRCPRYSLIVVSGVSVGPSPDWLVRRLALVGIRSVCNVVDVTNYVMMERGQPLHAFDASQIRGGKVVVRPAGAGEKILTLDGEERSLEATDLVIADAEGAIAIAGVMGGKGSEVGEGTETIALESAFFNPISVRRTSRRLGLQTESSIRFERGVDPEAVVPALHRAAGMLREIAGGEVTRDWCEVASPGTRRTIPLGSEEVSNLLGGVWNGPEIAKVLKGLGLRKKGRGWEVPSFRHDLVDVPDLVEEVARLKGLDRIPTTFPVLRQAPPTPPVSWETRIRRQLSAVGFSEVIHFSFISPQELKSFDESLVASAVPIENPLGVEDSLLRPTLIPSLLKTVSLHHRHRVFDVRLFEFRKIFRRAQGGVEERPALAAALTGTRLASHWSLPKGETDFYDAKGVVERLFKGLGQEGITFQDRPHGAFHPGQSVGLRLGDEEIGILGQIHPDVTDRFEIKRKCYAFELLWEPIQRGLSSRRRFGEFSLFPKVERDVSLVIGEEVRGGEVQEAIVQVDPERIWRVRLFDLYRGPPVAAGKKSLSFALEMGRRDRTMTEREIDEIVGKVLETVQSRFGAQIR